MRIINCGTGIHKREIKGIEKLQSLSNDWYAYTNLDIANAPGTSREIDVIMVADDRIFLIDLKDWQGRIESQDGNWIKDGRDHGPSPVAKINQNGRSLYLMLKAHLQKHHRGPGLIAPRIQGMVVLTGNADTSGIAESEAANVITIDRFLSIVSSVRDRIETFGRVPPAFVEEPLTGPYWKNQLSKFFNVSKGIFRPGRRDYGGFFATSDAAVFEHPRKIYAEFDASDERAAAMLGTLRLWDFSKAETRFQNEEGRAEIIGREQQIAVYLRDRSDRCGDVLLDTRSRDPSERPAYWEVFDRRRRLQRLGDFTSAQGSDLTRDAKLELARQILSAIDALHLTDAAHLDLGTHSIWLTQPSTVRISHLMAASYPQVQSLGESRYQFLSSAVLPENVLGERIDPKRKDVFLAGVAVHRLIFGKAPSAAKSTEPPEWKPEIDATGDFNDLHAWFARSLC